MKGCFSYKRKYVHKVLVNRLVKLVQEKVWLGEMTVPPMTIAVDWDVKKQTPIESHIYNDTISME